MQEEAHLLNSSSSKKSWSISSIQMESKGLSVVALMLSIVSVIIAISVAFAYIIHGFQDLSFEKNASCRASPLTCDLQASTQREFAMPKSALVICAHPDDIETVAGGTVAKWALDGTEINFVLVTNGDRGGRNLSQSSDEISATRQLEQRNAAKVLGVKNTNFLNFKDGLVFEDDQTLLSNISYYIRLYRPEVVLTWSHELSTQLFITGLEHSDHRNTGRAVLASVYPNAGSSLYYPEHGLAPFRPATVLLFRFGQPRSEYFVNEFVHVSLQQNDMDKKIEALMQHESQMPTVEAKNKMASFVREMGKRFSNLEQIGGNAVAFELFTVVKFNGVS